MKRNPVQVSSANATIDLTPLLDVIFILLFVVLLSFVQIVQQESVLQSQQIEDLQQELMEYQSQEYDYETVAESYQESIQQYEELDRIVKKVTIFCNYDHNNPSFRTIRIIIPGRETETIQLSREYSNKGYELLKKKLKDYIEENLSNIQQEDGNITNNNASFIVIFLSLDHIQRGDREGIDKIASDLMESYEHVYYRKFRANIESISN